MADPPPPRVICWGCGASYDKYSATGAQINFCTCGRNLNERFNRRGYNLAPIAKAPERSGKGAGRDTRTAVGVADQYNRAAVASSP